jgi:hypothetical protein
MQKNTGILEFVLTMNEMYRLMFLEIIQQNINHFNVFLIDFSKLYLYLRLYSA